MDITNSTDIVSLVSTVCCYSIAQLITRPHLTAMGTRGLLLQTDLRGLSVGRSDTILSPAKTAEPIEMPFGVWTWVSPRNHVLDGVQITRANG